MVKKIDTVGTAKKNDTLGSGELTESKRVCNVERINVGILTWGPPSLNLTMTASHFIISLFKYLIKLQTLSRSVHLRLGYCDCNEIRI